MQRWVPGVGFSAVVEVEGGHDLGEHEAGLVVGGGGDATRVAHQVAYPDRLALGVEPDWEVLLHGVVDAKERPILELHYDDAYEGFGYAPNAIEGIRRRRLAS